MEIVSVESLKKGDIIIVDLHDRTEIVTVEKTDQGLIISKEWCGLDFSPEDPDCIIKLGSKKEPPTIIVAAEKISLGLSKFWEGKWQQPF